MLPKYHVSHISLYYDYLAEQLATRWQDTDACTSQELEFYNNKAEWNYRLSL